MNFERNFMKFEKTKRKSLIKFPNFHKKTGVRPRGTPRNFVFASLFRSFSRLARRLGDLCERYVREKSSFRAARAQFAVASDQSLRHPR